MNNEKSIRPGFPFFCRRPTISEGTVLLRSSVPTEVGRPFNAPDTKADEMKEKEIDLLNAIDGMDASDEIFSLIAEMELVPVGAKMDINQTFQTYE